MWQIALVVKNPPADRRPRSATPGSRTAMILVVALSIPIHSATLGNEHSGCFLFPLCLGEETGSNAISGPEGIHFI